MDLTYYGHSTFELETQGTTLLFDPFFADNPHTDAEAESFDPDVLLLTHAHFDHYSGVEGVLEGSDPLVIGNFEVTQRISQDYNHDDIQPLNEGGHVDFDWGTVKATHARHSSSFPDGSYGGVPQGFVLDLEGGVVYNTGDTSPFAEMEWIGDLWDVDLMLAPIGNVFTMDIYGALHCAEMAEPNRVAPLHYDTFPPLEVELDEFEEAFSDAGFEPVVFDIGEATTL